MLSLDPATITDRRYPELFQTGETAYGKPLVDAQHPHNFIMGLGIHYAHPLGENAILQFYFAPVGDPALGPVAFPHRASADELPQATLSHHWQDSTHIADEVITAGIMLYNKVRLEASGFYGTEPSENRWIIDYGPINSWSTRLSVFPTENWMGQFSVGRIATPERQEPGDVVRATASIHYTRPMQGSSWSTSLIWGRNHETLNRRNLNSYLLESVAPYRRRISLPGESSWWIKTSCLATSRIWRHNSTARWDPLFALGHTLPDTRATSAHSTRSRPESERTSLPTRCPMRSNLTMETILFR